MDEHPGVSQAESRVVLEVGVADLRGSAHAVLGEPAFRFLAGAAMHEDDRGAGGFDLGPGRRDIGDGFASEGAAKRAQKDDEGRLVGEGVQG